MAHRATYRHNMVRKAELCVREEEFRIVFALKNENGFSGNYYT